jgi:hypothetical protein
MDHNDIEIFSTCEKVYVEYQGLCIARLCKVSGEFFEIPSMFNLPFKTCQKYLPRCSLEEFKSVVKSEYGVDISDEHKPDWC